MIPPKHLAKRLNQSEAFVGASISGRRFFLNDAANVSDNLFFFLRMTEDFALAAPARQAT